MPVFRSPFGQLHRGLESGRLVGGIYAANTVGAILGSIVFSFLLIPLIGTQQAQRLLIGLSIVAALLAFSPLLWRFREGTALPSAEESRQLPRRRLRLSGAFLLASSAGLVLLLLRKVPLIPWELIAYGRSLPAKIGEGRPLFIGEGMNASVAVTGNGVEFVIGDARHYILTTHKKFDIITSDPIHPWLKGSAILYTKDYFDMCKRHLKPGGFITQWVPLYQSDTATLKSAITTFFTVFPNGTIWSNDLFGWDYYIVLT